MLPGLPSNDPAHHAQLLNDLYAIILVQDARFRALKQVVLEAFAALKVNPPPGKTLDGLITELADKEIAARLAQIADDDPAHAAALRRAMAGIRPGAVAPGDEPAGGGS